MARPVAVEMAEVGQAEVEQVVAGVEVARQGVE